VGRLNRQENSVYLDADEALRLALEPLQHQKAGTIEVFCLPAWSKVVQRHAGSTRLRVHVLPDGRRSEVECAGYTYAHEQLAKGRLGTHLCLLDDVLARLSHKP